MEWPFSATAIIEFDDSMFIGINGFHGAALLIFASNITLTGSILANNTAASGGSIYLTDNSTLFLNGTSLFLNYTGKNAALKTC